MGGGAQNGDRAVFPSPLRTGVQSGRLLNSDIKRNAGAKQSPRSQEELETNVQNRLDYLSATPDHVASFFQAPYTCYAA